jgi:asparagine synthase (glutamine-hydrolysing)
VCAIYGQISLDGAPIDRQAAANALQAMAMRGPDACAVAETPCGLVGQNRLRIVDLDPRADAPLWDVGRRRVIVFNGEIFNHQALRNELRARGRVFRTSGDTEVILQAFDQWGEACLDHLTGMFAFAILDLESRSLFLARDRLGVKPLYYAPSNGEIRFASNAWALAASLGQTSLRSEAIVDFLMLRAPLDASTLFEAVQALEPGYLLCFSAGGVRLRRYWRPNLDPATVSSPDEVLACLRTAIAEQTQSERPPAALLSGGLDSAVLVCEAAPLDPRLTAFSAAFPEHPGDEAEHAAQTAVSLGLDIRRVVAPAPTVEALARLQRVRGQPLAMHNEWAMSCLAEAISQHGPVALCGEGADELFCGYGRLARFEFDWRRAQGLSVLSLGGGGLARRLAVDDLAAATEPLDGFLTRYRYIGLGEANALLGSTLGAMSAHHERQLASLLRASSGAPTLSRAIDAVLLNIHLPRLLDMIDAMLMSHGVEGRVPYCDHRLVDAALALPRSERLRWRGPLGALRGLGQPVASFSERQDETKVLLRRAYAQRLSPAVLTRPKAGFPTPLGDWLGGPLGRLFESDRLALWDLADKRAVRGLYGRAQGRGDERAWRQLWMLLNLEIFLQSLAAPQEQAAFPWAVSNDLGGVDGL